jgi:nucleoside-diphosphate-sugar epimerase
MTKKVIIFGASGAIGLKLTEIVSGEQPDWEVFAVSRNAKAKETLSKYSNVTVIPCDACNKEEILSLTADKDIIYCSIGFPQYTAKFWAKTWPLVVDNILEASNQKEGQKLVFCDNIYAYGAATNISPTSKTVPPSLKSKPGVRAILREKFQKRMDEKPDSIVVVGSSDFFGPNLTETTFLGDTFTKAILEGKKAPICLGSSTKIHDFAYGPDLSKALYIVSVDDEANGKFWICPHAIKNKTFTRIAQDVARLEGGNKKSKVTVYAAWSVKLLGLFIGDLKNMVEMLPIWVNDYSVDDSDFRKTFDMEPTPYEEALKDYISFYKTSVLDTTKTING